MNYSDRTGQDYIDTRRKIGKGWAKPESLWECHFCRKMDLRLRDMTFLSYDNDMNWLCFCNETCKNCYILRIINNE